MDYKTTNPALNSTNPERDTQDNDLFFFFPLETEDSSGYDQEIMYELEINNMLACSRLLGEFQANDKERCDMLAQLQNLV